MIFLMYSLFPTPEEMQSPLKEWLQEEKNPMILVATLFLLPCDPYDSMFYFNSIR